MDALIKALVAILLILLLVNSCEGVPNQGPRDDTDSPTARSGMELHTDYGTGCQYLTYNGKGLTPRLDEAGKPICKGKLN